MQTNEKLRFCGIDGCPGGWIAVFCTKDARYTEEPVLAKHLEELLRPPEEILALIDMPIGLADAAPGKRACDELARKLLAKRRSTIFSPPVRQALSAPDYATACAIQQQVGAKRISVQAWNLVPRIRQVDAYLQRRPEYRGILRESHPELCFAALNGGVPLAEKKRTAAGKQQRLALLSRLAPEAPARLEAWRRRFPARRVHVDDFLDAMVLALHAALGEAHGFVSLPPMPEYDATGLPMEIVFARLPDQSVDFDL